MKRKRWIAPIVLSAFLSLSLAAQTTPDGIRVQGALTDNTGGSGTPATGNYSLTFELFDSELGGTLVAASGAMNVFVDEGFYETILPFSPSAFDGPVRYLEVSVDGEILQPRIQFAAVPYCYMAEKIDGYEGADLEETEEIATIAAGLQQQIDDVNLIAVGGGPGDVQYKTLPGGLGAEPEFHYDSSSNTLFVARIAVGDGTASDSCIDWDLDVDQRICWSDAEQAFSISRPFVFGQGAAEDTTFIGADVARSDDDAILRFDASSDAVDLHGFGQARIRTSVEGQAPVDSMIVGHDRIEISNSTLKQPSIVHGTLTADGGMFARRINGSFQCGFDWDGDGNTVDDAEDVVLCLDAARASLTGNEDGTDNAVRIFLPGGNFDFCNAVAASASGSGPGGGCPYTLKSGMQIEGVYPRTTENEFAPDLALEPNGGTWLDGSSPGNTMFNGNALRGVVWSKVGFKNFGTAFDHGEPHINGISMSRYEDLYFIGIENVSGTAVKLMNFQHVRMDYMKFAAVNRCLHLLQHGEAWAGANSVLTDVYCSVDSDPQGAILLENAGQVESLNFITMVRPQVNAFEGFISPDTSLIWLKTDPEGAAITGVEIYGADVEGNAEVGIKMTGNVFDSYVSIANVAPNPLVHLLAEYETRYNVFMSSSAGVVLRNESPTNMIYGTWGDTSSSTYVKGFFEEAGQAGNIVAEINRLTNSGLWVDVEDTADTYGVLIEPIFESDTYAEKASFVGLHLRPVVTDNDGSGRSDFDGIRVDPKVIGVAGEDVVIDFNAVHASPQVGGDCQWGECMVIENLRGLQVDPVFYGDNWRIDDVELINVESPTGLPANAVLLDYSAFRVEDQLNTGSSSTYTGRIRPQVAQPGGDVGNWWFEGQGHDQGHPVVGDYHIWDSNGSGLRVKSSAPIQDDDGAAIVTSSGSSDQGPAIWSRTTDDCGTVCANAGLQGCVDTALFGSGPTGNCTDTSPVKVCFCK